MNNKKLAQAVIDKYGEESQRMIMIEEMAELTAAICQFQRGRYCIDHVAEEVADCLVVLDQMDILFDVPVFEEKNIDYFFGYPFLLSLVGHIQYWLGDYEGFDIDRKKLNILFFSFRAELIKLSVKIGQDRVEAWQKIKYDRMVERLDREVFDDVI